MCTIWCEDKDNGCITNFNISGSKLKAERIFKQHYSKKYKLHNIVQK